jgi:hypothetical protein
VAAQLGNQTLMIIVVVLGLLFGLIGVSGIVGGCIHLFYATELSLANIRSEAAQIRTRQQQRSVEQK